MTSIAGLEVENEEMGGLIAALSERVSALEEENSELQETIASMRAWETKTNRRLDALSGGEGLE